MATLSDADKTDTDTGSDPEADPGVKDSSPARSEEEGGSGEDEAHGSVAGGETFPMGQGADLSDRKELVGTPKSDGISGSGTAEIVFKSSINKKTGADNDAEGKVGSPRGSVAGTIPPAEDKNEETGDSQQQGGFGSVGVDPLADFAILAVPGSGFKVEDPGAEIEVEVGKVDEDAGEDSTDQRHPEKLAEVCVRNAVHDRFGNSQNGFSSGVEGNPETCLRSKFLTATGPI